MKFRLVSTAIFFVILFSCRKHDTKYSVENSFFKADIAPGMSMNYSTPSEFKPIGWVGEQLILTWNQIPNATRYLVEWSNSPTFMPAETKKIDSAVSPYIHNNLINGKKYFYRLKYVDQSGNIIDTKLNTTATPTEYIAIENSGYYNINAIPVERIKLGNKGFNYKPTMIQLSDNSLIAMTFFGETQGQNYIERISQYQSFDDGKSWTNARIIDQIKGREPVLSKLSDGTIIVTTQLLDNDMRNRKGYAYSFLYASSDGGASWVESIFDENITTVITRNVVELPDKSLLLGVSTYGGKSYIYKSTDRGKTWSGKKEVLYNKYPSNYPWGFFEEGVFWLSNDNTINLIVRADSHYIPIKSGDVVPNNDQTDRMMLYSSTDGGTTYSYTSDIGSYGEMYPHLLKLNSGYILLTYTVRSLNYPIGLRAILGFENANGLNFNFNLNKFLIDAKTPFGIVSGGGFGNTLQLKDGSLISCYSFRHSDNIFDAEIIRWGLPK